MSLIEPPIKVETGSITIRTGLDTEGDVLYTVEVEGRIPYLHALGMLEAAKQDLDELCNDNLFGE